MIRVDEVLRVIYTHFLLIVWEEFVYCMQNGFAVYMAREIEV